MKKQTIAKAILTITGLAMIYGILFIFGCWVPPCNQVQNYLIPGILTGVFAAAFWAVHILVKD